MSILVMVLAFVGRADMPGKTRYHYSLALHRIGYEIFPELGPNVWIVHLVIVVLAMALGCGLLFAFKRGCLSKEGIAKLQLWMCSKHGRLLAIASRIWGNVKRHREVLALWGIVLVVAGGVLLYVGGSMKELISLANSFMGRDVHITYGLKEPAWRVDGSDDELMDLRRRAHEVCGDLESAVREIVMKYKIEALRRSGIRLLKDMTIEEAAEIVHFPIPHEYGGGLGAVLDKFDWATRPEWEKRNGRWGKVKRWITETDEDSLVQSKCKIGDDYYGVKTWQREEGEKIPQDWLPSRFKSDLDLIREALSRSPELRQRCIGLPVEYFRGVVDKSFSTNRGTIGHWAHILGERH